MVVPALKYRQLSDLSQTRSLVPPLNVASPSVVDPSEVTVPITFNPVDANSTTVVDPEIQLRVVDVISILPGPLAGSEIISNCPFFSLRIDVVPS